MDSLIIFTVGLIFIVISPLFSVPNSIKKKKYLDKLLKMLALGFTLPDKSPTMYGVYRGMFLVIFGELIIITSMILFISNQIN